MKLLFFLLFLLPAFAGIETLNFKVVPGKYHTGGKCSAEILSTDNDKQVMVVRLAYEIQKKDLVPIPEKYLKKTIDLEMPLDFIDERGFLKLEISKTLVLEKGTLKYMGRVKLGHLENGHRVKIVAKNGRTETDIFYHPHLPELGWGKLFITIHTGLPFVGDYSLEAELINL